MEAARQKLEESAGRNSSFANRVVRRIDDSVPCTGEEITRHIELFGLPGADDGTGPVGDARVLHVPNVPRDLEFEARQEQRRMQQRASRAYNSDRKLSAPLHKTLAREETGARNGVTTLKLQKQVLDVLRDYFGITGTTAYQIAQSVEEIPFGFNEYLQVETPGLRAHERTRNVALYLLSKKFLGWCVQQLNQLSASGATLLKRFSLPNDWDICRSVVDEKCTLEAIEVHKANRVFLVHNPKGVLSCTIGGRVQAPPTPVLERSAKFAISLYLECGLPPNTIEGDAPVFPSNSQHMAQPQVRFETVAFGIKWVHPESRAACGADGVEPLTESSNCLWKGLCSCCFRPFTLFCKAAMGLSPIAAQHNLRLKISSATPVFIYLETSPSTYPFVGAFDTTDPEEMWLVFARSCYSAQCVVIRATEEGLHASLPTPDDKTFGLGDAHTLLQQEAEVISVLELVFRSILNNTATGQTFGSLGVALRSALGAVPNSQISGMWL